MGAALLDSSHPIRLAGHLYDQAPLDHALHRFVHVDLSRLLRQLVRGQQQPVEKLWTDLNTCRQCMLGRYL
jgi:hypothetical protein